MKKYLILILTLLCFQAKAQQFVDGPKVKSNASFAIIIDSKTYNACTNEVQAYKSSVEREGLATYIIASEWKTPEEVKNIIKEYYNDKGLEGVVFVGDIPIPMIRRAQHFTSAFKMDQDRFSMFESSVPSDRFYDDFDLLFKFVEQDKEHTNCFYYNLTGESRQIIDCDIYTARIYPYLDGEAGYELLRKYLVKLVEEKDAVNYLDKIVSFTGHGSFSNSISAWKDESITLREQFPYAFDNADGAKFYLFNMYPYMKETVISELRRDDLDFFVFHEHGMPDRQYMTGNPAVDELDGYFDDVKHKVRYSVRLQVDRGKTKNEAKNYIVKRYGLDKRWWGDTFDKDIVAEDSLLDLKTGIILEDVLEIKPNSRLTIFDACYNGDFRERDCIASRYIFAEGRSVVSIGNSVNVLQDKSSSDLMGMLSSGYSVGEWMQQVNILESHIIGDPTFKFETKDKTKRPNLKSEDTKYWLKYLDAKYPCDIQSLALHKLFSLEYEGMADILLNTYKESPYYMQRLQCMHLLAHYSVDKYIELLKLSSDDPYEFIRRKGAYYMGKVGDESLIPYLVNIAMNDILSERVLFNVFYSGGHFKGDTLLVELKKAINESPYVYDKEKLINRMEMGFSSSIGTAKSLNRVLFDPNKPIKHKMFYLTGLRGMPYPYIAPELINMVKDNSLESKTRVIVTEVLGWFVRAYNKDFIISSLEKYMSEDKNISVELTDEIVKTINRLKEYSRDEK